MRFDALGELCSSYGYFKIPLGFRFVQVISSVFFGAWYMRKSFLRKKPLPYKIFGRARILLFERVRKKYSRVACGQIFLMQRTHSLLHVIEKDFHKPKGFPFLEVENTFSFL